jgi:hypothetical protein
MATKRKTSSSAGSESSVVSLSDADGRVHYTARGSAAQRKLEAGGATAEDVADEQTDEVAESGASTSA